ncbi:MAG: hypothetical protein RMN52_04335 [Anaerolineae bacterium]|nr:hypothetical protein [Candidatus Roseilinea sp.]MDW8449211.1 hypothetical protein [Anaerolineae bacterium]
MWSRGVAQVAFAACVAALFIAPLTWLQVTDHSAKREEGEAVWALKAEIEATFGSPVELTLEDPGPVLRVTFTDADYLTLSASRQHAKAREIARHMMWRYRGNRRVRGYIVEFTSMGLFGLHSREEMRSFAFLRYQLR